MTKETDVLEGYKKKALAEEAKASVALDGETQSDLKETPCGNCEFLRAEIKAQDKEISRLEAEKKAMLEKIDDIIIDKLNAKNACKKHTRSCYQFICEECWKEIKKESE